MKCQNWDQKHLLEWLIWFFCSCLTHANSNNRVLMTDCVWVSELWTMFPLLACIECRRCRLLLLMIAVSVRRSVSMSVTRLISAARAVFADRVIPYSLCQITFAIELARNQEGCNDAVSGQETSCCHTTMDAGVWPQLSVHQTLNY